MESLVAELMLFQGPFYMPKKHILGKHWNVIMYLLYWPFAAKLKWQWILASLQGSRHDYHFGIIHSWQQEWIIVSVSLSASVFSMHVCVSATRNGNLGFLSGKCLLSLLSSSTRLLSFVFLCCLFLPMSLLLCSAFLSVWLWIFNMAAS